MNYMPPEAIEDRSSYGENGKSRSKVVWSSSSYSLHVKKEVIKTCIFRFVFFSKSSTETWTWESLLCHDGGVQSWKVKPNLPNYL